MRFPHAAKGIKKIFSAEIFNLIAIVAFGVAMVLGIIIAYGKEEGNEVALGVSSIGFLVCLAGAAVLAVLALILNSSALFRVQRTNLLLSWFYTS